MDAVDIATLLLWLLIVAIVIVVIVWICCVCQQKDDHKTAVIAFGEGKRSQNDHPRYSTENGDTQVPQFTEQQLDHLMQQEAAASVGSTQEFDHPADAEMIESPFASGQGSGDQDLLPYDPYGAGMKMPNHGGGQMTNDNVPVGATGGGPHAAYASNYPTDEDPAARFPSNPDASLCKPADSSDKYGYNLDVDHLMPLSWRAGGKKCGDESQDETQWAAYAPSKAAFDSYITTAGSARLGVNTRSSMARKIGLPDLVANAVRGCSSGGPPVPIGADPVLFGDSDLRQTAIYQSTGKYPNMTWC